MARLTVFNSISLDGYFSGPNGDLSWAHKQDPEWMEFVSGNASGDGILLFGRVTYQMMESFWPTPMAAEQMPETAAGMNKRSKIVFSRTLPRVTWANTTLYKDNLENEIARLKDESKQDITILGSGSIVSQLSRAGLIDHYQLALCPVAIGAGKTMFDGSTKLDLRLTNSRAFKNGAVVLDYDKD